MDRNTTIPSILSAMDEPADNRKSTGDGTILKLVFWGAIGVTLVMLARYFLR